MATYPTDEEIDTTFPDNTIGSIGADDMRAFQKAITAAGIDYSSITENLPAFGSMAFQERESVAITGGTISGVTLVRVVGQTIPLVFDSDTNSTIRWRNLAGDIITAEIQHVFGTDAFQITNMNDTSGTAATRIRLSGDADLTRPHRFYAGGDIATEVASVAGAGTTMPFEHTLVTKEKGDAAYVTRAEFDALEARVLALENP